MRPCIANGVKCIFHQWTNVATVIPPSSMIGGAPGGQSAFTVALIELEDGTMRTAYPKDVTFIDGLAGTMLHELVTFEPKEETNELSKT